MVRFLYKMVIMKYFELGLTVTDEPGSKDGDNSCIKTGCTCLCIEEHVDVSGVHYVMNKSWTS